MEEQDGLHPISPSSSSAITISSIIAKSSSASSSTPPPGMSTTDSHQTNSKAIMNNNSKEDNKVVQALFTMAEARSAVTELGRCWQELREQCDQEKKVADLAQTCDQVARLLEEEKKVHQEELKQINKDLNLLEDFLRDRKPRLAQKRAKSERKMDELLRNMVAIDVRQNDLLRLAGDGSATTNEQNGQIPSAEDHQNDGQFWAEGPDTAVVHHEHVQHDDTVTPFSGQQQFFLWAFQWFMLMHQQQQQQCQQQLQNINNTFGTSSSNNSLAMMTTTMRHHHQHHYPQQQAKMKKCLFCFEEIHRNAPTCPFCKKKITSKAAKRVRK